MVHRVREKARPLESTVAMLAAAVSIFVVIACTLGLGPFDRSADPQATHQAASAE